MKINLFNILFPIISDNLFYRRPTPLSKLILLCLFNFLQPLLYRLLPFPPPLRLPASFLLATIGHPALLYPSIRTILKLYLSQDIPIPDLILVPFELFWKPPIYAASQAFRILLVYLPNSPFNKLIITINLI